MGQQAEALAGRYRWKDFIGLDEDDPRELLDGRLVEIEVPTWTHERIVAALIAILGQWSMARKAGQVIGSGYKLRISDRRGAMPDVQFYRRGNFPVEQEKGLERGRPDLAIEVISPSSRSKDSVRKLQDYASIEVPEYWLVEIAGVPVDNSLQPSGKAIFRIDLQCLLGMVECFVVSSSDPEQRADIHESTGRKRVEPNGLFAERQRLVVLSIKLEQICKIEVCAGEAGVEFNRSPESRLCTRKVSFVIKLEAADAHMRLGN